MLYGELAYPEGCIVLEPEPDPGTIYFSWFSFIPFLRKIFSFNNSVKIF